MSILFLGRVQKPADVSSLLHYFHRGSAGFPSAIATIAPLYAVRACIVLSCIVAALLWLLVITYDRLCDSRLTLATVLDSSSDGIALVDRKRVATLQNAAFARMLGLEGCDTLSREEICAKFDPFATGGTPLPTDALPTELAATGEFAGERELTYHRKDTGGPVILRIRAIPVPVRSGRSKKTILTFRDMTANRSADETMTRMASVLESSEHAIIGLGLDATILGWNAGAKRIFGYSAEEMIGRSASRLLPHEHEQNEDEQEVMRRILLGETVDHIDTLRLRKDGGAVPVSITLSPILGEHGGVIGATQVVRDISWRKALEKQLHQSQKMEAIGQLTGGIAHDFNNLLAIVLGNLELMELGIPGGSLQKRIDVAKRAALRGAAITKRLLTFASQEPLSPTVTSLNDSIRDVVEMAERALGCRIQIQTSLSVLMPRVFVDLSGLESALLNLAVNARDAMPGGGRLMISTQVAELDASCSAVQTGEAKAGKYACVSVSDTGEGMSKETMDRVFEPFFTTKERGKGTGLGLAMVYGFIRQSKGFIRIYSEQGNGTTFLLYLPLAGATPEEGMVSPEWSHPAYPAYGSLLVVDDEPDLLEIALAYLSEMGYTAYAARGAAEALELTLRHRIDVVVCDIMIPGEMNGVDLASSIRRRHPRTKMIYSSGSTEQTLREGNVDLGDAPFLRKPFRRAEFESAIRREMRTAVWLPHPNNPETHAMRLQSGTV